MQDLSLLRHSASHLMAAAIQELWPSAKFGVGPAAEKGFYYDIEFPNPIKDTDLVKIEKRMRKIASRKLSFEREELEIKDAISFMQENGQSFKVELLTLIKEKGTTQISKELDDKNLIENNESMLNRAVSFYKLGKFIDLCRGPHVQSTSEIKYFKLLNIAGAYWRGNEDNTLLTRIYGAAFYTKEELNQHLWQLEEIKKRDHRKLGKELGLFSFSQEVGSGLPLWLPNGTIVRDELEYLARRKERREGYMRVL